jgi:hypothetical protein
MVFHLVILSIPMSIVETWVLHWQLEISIWPALVVGLLGNIVATGIAVSLTCGWVWKRVNRMGKSSRFWEIVNEGHEEYENNAGYEYENNAGRYPSAKEFVDIICLISFCWLVSTWLEWIFAAIILERSWEVFRAVAIANLLTFLIATVVTILPGLILPWFIKD